MVNLIENIVKFGALTPFLLAPVIITIANKYFAIHMHRHLFYYTRLFPFSLRIFYLPISLFKNLITLKGTTLKGDLSIEINFPHAKLQMFVSCSSKSKNSTFTRLQSFLAHCPNIKFMFETIRNSTKRGEQKCTRRNFVSIRYNFFC